jgi:hypothetical protein
MTEKDFKLIADVISTLDFSYGVIEEITDAFADALDDEFVRFDREKFTKVAMMH